MISNHIYLMKGTYRYLKKNNMSCAVNLGTPKLP